MNGLEDRTAGYVVSSCNIFPMWIRLVKDRIVLSARMDIERHTVRTVILMLLNVNCGKEMTMG